jgi:hypothetical protein
MILRVWLIYTLHKSVANTKSYMSAAIFEVFVFTGAVTPCMVIGHECTVLKQFKTVEW